MLDMYMYVCVYQGSQESGKPGKVMEFFQYKVPGVCMCMYVCMPLV